MKGSTLEKRMRALERELIPAESVTKRWIVVIVGSPSDGASSERTSTPYREVVWTPSPELARKRRS